MKYSFTAIALGLVAAVNAQNACEALALSVIPQAAVSHTPDGPARTIGLLISSPSKPAWSLPPSPKAAVPSISTASAWPPTRLPSPRPLRRALRPRVPLSPSHSFRASLGSVHAPPLLAVSLIRPPLWLLPLRLSRPQSQRPPVPVHHHW
jgi:hypothetical protein